MTSVLHVSFGLAVLLMRVGVGILAALCTSLFTRQIGAGDLLDLALFTVVFTSASVVTVWLAASDRVLSRPNLSATVKRLATYGVPLSSGVLAGVVGVA